MTRRASSVGGFPVGDATGFVFESSMKNGKKSVQKHTKRLRDSE
jgi:hypothetical protein